MRRNFYFTCVLGAKVAPGTVRKAKGDGQLRPEFLKLSQVATENSTPSLRRNDDAVLKNERRSPSYRRLDFSEYLGKTS